MQGARMMPKDTWTSVEAAQPAHEALCWVRCARPATTEPETHEAFYLPREGRWFLLRLGDYA